MPNHNADIALSAKLNQHRLRNALEQLDGNETLLLQQLPWLLHSNEAGQPGYVADAPTGFVVSPITPNVTELPDSCGPLLGLYTMGSSGSMGQNPESDFDCWLVCPDDLSEQQLQALELKCQRLSDYYLDHGIELHLFLLTPDWMNCGQRGTFSKEHSGSAQIWLLLEEFYRSHIHLAGKPVAWWPHAPQQHPKLISLGELRHLPLAEIFGGVLWHLFKGVDRPHKALLKILLLESYVADYPDLRILRDELWLQLKAGKPLEQLDHYQMMYQRIEAFLIRTNDQRRLTLLRRCFYLKCQLPLSKPAHRSDWREPILRHYCQQWQYDDGLIAQLDNALHWDASELQWFNERLNQAMTDSYQRLTHMAKHVRMANQLRLEELTVLARKLSAQFEQGKDKIANLNNLWSDSVAEDELTLVSLDSRPSTNQSWYLYRQPSDNDMLFAESPLFQHRSRLSCVMWAANNGLIYPDTKINCHQGDQRWFSPQLTEIGQRLVKWCNQAESVSFEDLRQPWFYRQAMVIANLDFDPTKMHPQASLWRQHAIDNPFSMGQPPRSMVGDLHLITATSWGERHCYHFSGDEALLQLLNQLFGGMGEDLAFELLCYAKHQTENIEAALQRAINEAKQRRVNSSEAPWFVEIAGQQYGIAIAKRQLGWHKFNDAKQLLQALTQRKSPLQAAPQAIRSHAREGLVQVFIEEAEQHYLLHQLDETNQLSTTEVSVDELAKAIDRFSLNHRTGATVATLERHAPSFSLPQFYWLRPDSNQQWQVSPYTNAVE